MVQVSADERSVHPVLWGAKGVAAAAREVAEARRAPVALAEERKQAHRAWREANRRNALKPGFEPAPEPNPGVEHGERAQLDARIRTAQAKLDAVVAANAEEVVEGLKAWEAATMRRVCELVGELEGLCRETALAGRALQTVSVSASPGLSRPRQPSPKVGDLVHLARKGEDVALLNFGDGRPMWLEATGRV